MSLQALEKITLLDGATTTGAGSASNVQRSKGWTFTIASTAVTAGATVDIEYYLSESGAWHVFHSESVTADGSVTIRDDHGHYEKLRANVSSRTDGTYSVYALGTVQSV
jgi:hypothetical protein